MEPAIFVNQKPQTLEALIYSLKQQIIEYMLEHHNITFLDDAIERKIYEGLLGFLEPMILELFT
jgi:hypothetical protein